MSNDEVIFKGGGSPQARFYRGDYDWMLCDLQGDCPEEEREEDEYGEEHCADE